MVICECDSCKLYVFIPDKNVIRKTGKVLITADIGDEYGFVDIDGKQ